MPRKPTYLAPFTPAGDLLHFANRHYASTAVPGASSGIDWRTVRPFTADLTIETRHSGRSAKYTEWLDQDGHRYPMFIKDLIGMLRETIIRHGTVKGAWIVCKRGENYGIRVATVADLTTPTA